MSLPSEVGRAGEKIDLQPSRAKPTLSYGYDGDVFFSHTPIVPACRKKLKASHVGVGRDRLRQNPMEPSSLHLCETCTVFVWVGPRGFRACPQGAILQETICVCKSLVSPGSCSDFGRDLILLRWASARSMMARAAGKDDDAYSITGTRTAEVTAGAGARVHLMEQAPCR